MTFAFLILSAAVIAVALSVIMSGAWLIRERTGNSGWVDTVWTVGLGLVGIILVSTLLNSEAWWARYTPQLWLAPFCVLACLLISRVGRSLVVLGYLLLAVMVLNVGLVSGAYAAGNEC